MTPIPESSAPQAFRDFEHERWQSAAEAYHGSFVRLTSQVAAPLIDAAHVVAGAATLDIASGPGAIAALAAARGARATGCDFSSEMVALARRLHPDVTFETGDAEALPFPDASFDAATMGFLLGHLGRPAAAVREAWRVLKPGGRLALSWWLSPEQCVAFAIMKDSIASKGDPNVALPPAPPFELFAQKDMLKQLLEEAGFTAIEIREIPMTWRIADATEMFEAYYHGTARTAGALRLQTPEALAAIRTEVASRCERWRTPEGLALPMPAHVAAGLKA